MTPFRCVVLYVVAQYHARAGATVTLDSSDSRHAFAGGGSARVQARMSAAPPRAGCVDRRVGDAHSELGNTDDVWVRRCGPPPRTDPSRVALCAPTLHGAYLRTPSSRRWAAAWLRHYRALGISHFFLYAAAPLEDWEGGADLTLVHAAWLNECRQPLQRGRTHYARCSYAMNRSLAYWGQNWVLNDCHQRAAAAGFGWVLSVDLDEVLALGGNRTLASLTAEAVDAHTFGSAVEKPRPCVADPCAGRAPPPPQHPHCVRCGDCEKCLGHRGRRKHLARTGRVGAANIHFVGPRACAPPCAVRDHATTHAWLRHFSGHTDGCPRAYCAARA